ncbi:fetal globin-inducing factor [Tritrichomonas foetus]|uniref:Fetal globin-inducing factor n=1 Tax=Tritrichomonas foetus TaxID=1144522 RepID=A0A1J4K7K0_9EUKA|nr:fetal globin-inducing factor [Tritrichomonas foetus]|eukprot:OHT07457.1 fetal globin-inducing factor [Tritrichomonas foetus]
MEQLQPFEYLRTSQTLTSIQKIILEFNMISDYTALHMATHRGRPEIVCILLSLDGIDINSQDEKMMTPLHIAANKGKFEVLKLLLDDPNINVNLQNSDGII